MKARTGTSQQDQSNARRVAPAAAGKPDDLDRRLMTVLRHNGRLAYAEIARSMGVSEATVRSRVDRLVLSGAISIAGWVNPAPIGFPIDAWVGIRVGTGQVKQVAESLAEVENVAYVVCVTGSFDILVEAFLPGTEGLFRFLGEGLVEIEGISRSETWNVLRTEKFFYNWRGEDLGAGLSQTPVVHTRAEEPTVVQGSIPHGLVELDDLDRHVIKLLRADGRLSYADIARAGGFSVATARRRVNRLVHNGAIAVMARVQPGAIGFPVSAYIGIRVEKGQIRNVGRTLARKDSVAYLAYMGGSFDILVQTYLPGTDDLLEFLDGDLAGIEGITHTETWQVLHTEKFFHSWQGEDIRPRDEAVE
jgi:DNA-binding Lrp family transcriptional regulator